MMIIDVAEYFIACSSPQRISRPPPRQITGSLGNGENWDFFKRGNTVHGK